jgi:hypothetical protein
MIAHGSWFIRLLAEVGKRAKGKGLAGTRLSPFPLHLSPHGVEIFE